ncbi:LacI family DNA-binding transcriptional regulator, partial [Paeniclostridium sordellii]|uniref:LacI family DNA-binding transcriptional regulator n=1 Tax=Paraclostridium sordellii TaxID=1505 RepID=UPI0012B150C8|nr:LacI family DNA-binding transcriptional regulator [Paeniclostridium sordellii]
MNIKTKDIASKSGVSIATVSRYLNKSGYVKQETRELIKKTIQEIKKQDKTYENEKNIAVVFPDLSNMFFTDVLKGLTEEADKLNYNVFSFDSGESIEKEMKIIDALKDFNICGLIITTTIKNRETTKEHVQNLNSLGIPVILIDRDLIFCDFDGIFSDNKKGAFDGVDTIIEGRTRKSSMGFGADIQSKHEKDVGQLFKEIMPADLLKFGLIPEFVGRLPILVTLESLNKEALIEILTKPKNALVKQYKKLFELDDVKLDFEDG